MENYSVFTDQELIDCLQKSNKDAFREIYERYWAQLYLHARRMLGDDESARDVVQEIFTGLWENRTEDVPRQLRAYLYRAIKNKVLNIFRHRKVAGHYLSELKNVLEEGEHRTEEDIYLNELTRLIEAEIRLLPPEIRKVFELSRKEHLTSAGIAKELNKSEQTVKKQISRAIQILKLKLSPYAPLFVLLFKITRP